jgi:hypothetical protein
MIRQTFFIGPLCIAENTIKTWILFFDFTQGLPDKLTDIV